MCVRVLLPMRLDNVFCRNLNGKGRKIVEEFGKFNIFMRIYPFFHLPQEDIICSCGGVFPVCMVKLPVIDFPPVTKKEDQVRIYFHKPFSLKIKFNS